MGPTVSRIILWYQSLREVVLEPSYIIVFTAAILLYSPCPNNSEGICDALPECSGLVRTVGLVHKHGDHGHAFVSI